MRFSELYTKEQSQRRFELVHKEYYTALTQDEKHELSKLNECLREHHLKYCTWEGKEIKSINQTGNTDEQTT